MLYSKEFNLNNRNDSLSLIYHFIRPQSRVLDILTKMAFICPVLERLRNFLGVRKL